MTIYAMLEKNRRYILAESGCRGVDRGSDGPETQRKRCHGAGDTHQLPDLSRSDQNDHSRVKSRNCDFHYYPQSLAGIEWELDSVDAGLPDYTNRIERRRPLHPQEGRKRLLLRR
jgi:hypothetical protein